LSSGKVGKDGELPYFLPLSRYYVRQKGVLEVGGNSCASCHTRIMPDGSFLEGAQGIVDVPFESVLKTLRPWVVGKKQFLESYTREFAVAQVTARQPGVVARQGSSPTHPPHIPSLIGVEDLRHLDATGLVHHRSIGDLMRYAIANQGLDTLAHFGDFQPSPQGTTFSGDPGTRYSDEQLYALALYIYSLKPPPNPNPLNDRARRGQKIFEQQGCAGWAGARSTIDSALVSKCRSTLALPLDDAQFAAILNGLKLAPVAANSLMHLPSLLYESRDQAAESWNRIAAPLNSS
jgi:hypothetical protein